MYPVLSVTSSCIASYFGAVSLSTMMSISPRTYLSVFSRKRLHGLLPSTHYMIDELLRFLYFRRLSRLELLDIISKYLADDGKSVLSKSSGFFDIIIEEVDRSEMVVDPCHLWTRFIVYPQVPPLYLFTRLESSLIILLVCKERSQFFQQSYRFYILILYYLTIVPPTKSARYKAASKQEVVLSELSIS